MSAARWSPVKELEDVRRDMERVFEEIFEPARRRRWWPQPQEGRAIVPGVDVFDRKAEIVVRAELPGAVREDINLTIEKNTLTLKGEIKKDGEVPDESYYLRERPYGPFSRTVNLPVEINPENVTASFRDGVLTIVLPKKEEARPKEIKVNIG